MRAAVAMRVLVLGGAACVGCAGTAEDYTPQIRVVPGAAARSLWIQSKNVGPDADPGAEEDDGAERVSESSDGSPNVDVETDAEPDAATGGDATE
jgi:hypothetical protein